jgi:hypothetical protein
MTQQIHVILMLEILGKPADYIKEALVHIVEKLGAEKNIKLLDKRVAEPKQIENQDAFTSFAEIELETDIETLMVLIFNYMPSHIEIITPESITMKNTDLNSFLMNSQKGFISMMILQEQ